MFKAIKEFFVSKPKVEDKPVEASIPEVAIVTPAPVLEEIKPETVTISISDNINVSVGSQSDTITLPASSSQTDTITLPPADPGAWPFPNTPPAETEVKKKRTPVKSQEPVTGKKPTPAITATKTKPRKKK